MRSRERLEVILRSSASPPGISLWRHFYDAEGDLDAYVQAMVRFYETFQWDFLKLNPRSTYYAEAWGVRFTPSGDPRKGSRLVFSPFQTLSDWRDRVQPQKPTQGVWAEQLEAIGRIRQALGPDVPLIQTVFSPLEICSRLLPDKWQLRSLLVQAPALFQDVMGAIAETLIGFISACVEAGADGVFYATQWAIEETPASLFHTFQRRYDLWVLRAVRSRCPYIVLHVCGRRVRVHQMLDYPVDMIHWDWCHPTNPTPYTLPEETQVVIIGGLSSTLLRTGPPEVIAEIVRTMKGPSRWILSVECTFPPDVPPEHLHAARKAIAERRGES